VLVNQTERSAIITGRKSYGNVGLIEPLRFGLLSGRCSVSIRSGVRLGCGGTAGVPLPRQIQIGFQIVVLGVVELGENEWNQPTRQASYRYAGSPVTMPMQAMIRLLSQRNRRSNPLILCLSASQTIFRSVSGVPFPIGVMGAVAQNKPNTQPEETE